MCGIGSRRGRDIAFVGCDRHARRQSCDLDRPLRSIVSERRRIVPRRAAHVVRRLDDRAGALPDFAVYGDNVVSAALHGDVGADVDEDTFLRAVGNFNCGSALAALHNGVASSCHHCQHRRISLSIAGHDPDCRQGGFDGTAALAVWPDHIMSIQINRHTPKIVWHLNWEIRRIDVVRQRHDPSAAAVGLRFACVAKSFL